MFSNKKFNEAIFAIFRKYRSKILALEIEIFQIHSEIRNQCFRKKKKNYPDFCQITRFIFPRKNQLRFFWNRKRVHGILNSYLIIFNIFFLKFHRYLHGPKSWNLPKFLYSITHWRVKGKNPRKFNFIKVPIHGKNGHF